MVQVIEREEEAAGAPCVVFHVYTRPNHPETVLGAVLFGAPDDERAYRWSASELGTPVGAAFERALGYAEMHAMPFIQVDDPNSLFPPELRPIGQDRGRRGRRGRSASGSRARRRAAKSAKKASAGAER